MADVHRADPKFRRLFFGFMGLLLVIMWPIRAGIEQYFGWLGQNPERLSEVWQQIVVIIVIAFLPLLFLGVQLYGIGKQVIIAQCFPSPGMKTVTDMSVIKGRPAVWRGHMLRLCGVMLGCGAIAIPILFAMILQSLSQSAS